MTTRSPKGAGTDAAVANGARKEELPFEKALARLEKIVADMEQGKMPLEEMISRFEEGQSLIRFCTRKLNEVERRIEILVRKGDEVVAEPFEEPVGDAKSAGSGSPELF